MAVRTNSRMVSRNKNNWQTLAGFAFLSFAIIFLGFILRKSNNATPVSNYQPRTKIVAQFDTVNVPVPKRKVRAGTLAKDIPLTMVAFPKHQLPDGALLNLSQIQEAAATADLPKNLPLFRENFSFTMLKSNPVIESIPKGMRAITLRVDVTSAVEGWAGSGAKVDMLLVQKDKTIVVAENVKILSAERSVAPVSGSSSPEIPTTVTVLVSKEQALAINTAIPRGKIAFALRSIGDEGKWQDKFYDAKRLEGGKKIVRRESKSISGYATVKAKNKEYKFALSNGEWVRTKSLPRRDLSDIKKD